MYCAGCEYDLRGLPESRCPECGRTFDPRDSRTFLHSPKLPKPLGLALAAYLIPLAIGGLFWLTVRLPFACPLWVRIRAVGSLMCGPALFAARDAAPLVGPLIWLGWVLLLYRTRVRNMPYWVHAGIALLWLFAGCIPLGISV